VAVGHVAESLGPALPLDEVRAAVDERRHLVVGDVQLDADLFLQVEVLAHPGCDRFPPRVARGATPPLVQNLGEKAGVFATLALPCIRTPLTRRPV
jgi:hypothetical protein